MKSLIEFFLKSYHKYGAIACVAVFILAILAWLMVNGQLKGKLELEFQNHNQEIVRNERGLISVKKCGGSVKDGIYI